MCLPPVAIALLSTNVKRCRRVCRKGRRTLARNLLFAFAFPRVQRGVPKAQRSDAATLSYAIDVITATREVFDSATGVSRP